ncbi:MAG: hypothetical protein F6K08_02325 [Okeania sp. SIO1H6]|nr:hypothetical protein [Okeania sp. SIO1H6]
MQPKDYCAKWIPRKYGITPEQWGYKAKCLEELEQVTGLARNTLKNWKDLTTEAVYVQKLLFYADFYNELSEFFKKYSEKKVDINTTD